MDFSQKTARLLRKYEIDFESRLIENDQYDDTLILNPKTDIILEAKRMILNEQMEKIINANLSDVFEKKSDHRTTKECRQTVEWNSEIWNNVPPPKRLLENKKLEIKSLHYEFNKEIAISNALIFQKINKINEKQTKRLTDKHLLKKYFKAWKKQIDTNKLKLEIAKYEIIQKEKLELFFKTLKRKKHGECQDADYVKPIQSDVKENTTSNSVSEISDDKPDIDCKISVSDNSDKSNKFQNRNDLKNVKTQQKEFVTHRFKAQTDIIVMQKAKLMEQEKIIEELKLGKIREDLNKSIESSKNSIREIFSQCSLKTKVKMPILIEDNQFRMTSNKAPKIVRKMEERAKERELNRQIIQERKRVIDEQRKRLVEKIVEEKRVQEEEEKTKNLEAIKERRRKEVESEKMRQKSRQRYLDDCIKADKFRELKLKLLGMNCFKKLIVIKTNRELLSEVFYEEMLKTKYFNKWKLFLRNIVEAKNKDADHLYNTKLLRICFNALLASSTNARRNYQVAVDYHDMQLQCKVFKNLHRFVCKQQMIRYGLYRKAATHFNNRILVQYFYQWRSLKAVLQLEKAKEQKKQKWREKVMEILPDFQPPIDAGYL